MMIFGKFRGPVGCLLFPVYGIVVCAAQTRTLTVASMPYTGVSVTLDPAADPDGDGVSNQAEFLAGTLALSGSSFLRPGLSLTVPNGKMEYLPAPTTMPPAPQ